MSALARLAAFTDHRFVGVLALAIALFGWLGHGLAPVSALDPGVPVLSLSVSIDPVDRAKTAAQPVPDQGFDGSALSDASLPAIGLHLFASMALGWIVLAVLPLAPHASAQPRAPPYSQSHV